MKSNTRNDIQEDKIAAIGIGAMIVFIALILVAAVAAAVIIQTAEKLQQNAQKTGDDTADNMAGKLMISQGFVATGGVGGAPAAFTAAEAYMFFVRLAPGSDAAPLTDISFQFFCDDGMREGFVADPDGAGPIITSGSVALMDGDGATFLADTASLDPSTAYVLWLDANGGGGAGGADCSPDEGDTSIEMYIHIASGGTTYETLNIDSTTAGSAVV